MQSFIYTYQGGARTIGMCRRNVQRFLKKYYKLQMLC